MSKKAINSAKAPAAVGPYSHACADESTVYVSGQLPVRNGELILDDIAEATKACMENIGFILEECGSSMDKILKATIYVTDMNDFAVVNEAYGSFFKDQYPARVCVEVAALPKGAKVEIDAIATCK